MFENTNVSCQEKGGAKLSPTLMAYVIKLFNKVIGYNLNNNTKVIYIMYIYRYKYMIKLFIVNSPHERRSWGGGGSTLNDVFLSSCSRY